MKEQEINQEPIPTAEPETLVETPENPKNPLNVYVNDYEKLKGNGYAKDYVDGNAVVKEEDAGKGDDFVSSLILDDFVDEEEYSSYGEGSASAFMEGLFWKEQETLYRQSQGLEEEREPYI